MIEPIHTEEPLPSGFRELTQEEIKSVEYLFLNAGTQLPDPRYSNFLGQVENGRVVAFLVLQLKVHAEPMWIEEGKSELFIPLARFAEQFVLNRVGPCWVYLFAPAGRVARLAETVGMQVEPYVVMSKLVMPEEPIKHVVTLDTPAETEVVQ